MTARRPHVSHVMDRAVTDGEDGQRVDVALGRWLGEPRSASQQRLRDGDVSVNGRPVAKSYRVRAGDRVRVRAAVQAPPPPPPDPVPVRFEDEHLAVVAKPAGVVVHPGAGVTGGTLVDALRAMGLPLAPSGGEGRPGVVHRLDRGTSGLLVVAKTDNAYRGLVRLFRLHDVDRAYWALVDGVPSPARATIDAPIGRHPERRTRFRVDAAGKRAVSHYDVREDFRRAAVLGVRIDTGRTHQVRVHLAGVGHPVAGDRAYGASDDLRLALALHRPALHADGLGFVHPVTGGRVDVSEPLPADLEDAVRRLRDA